MARLILDVVLAPFLLKTATPAGNVSDSKGSIAYLPGGTHKLLL